MKKFTSKILITTALAFITIGATGSQAFAIQSKANCVAGADQLVPPPAAPVVVTPAVTPRTPEVITNSAEGGTPDHSDDIRR